VEAALGLPEPSGTLALLAGATLLAVLGHRRYAP
jgi:hypothetical protein